MDERVLVTNLQARHPPVLHIRMIAVGDVNRAPAPQPPLVAVIEELQSMQIVQVPADRRMLAVDLQSVQRLVPARVASRFESRQRPVAESGQEGAGIVNPYRFDLSGQ